MIESVLLNLALTTGRLCFEEQPLHYKLYVRWGGMKISVVSITKEQFAAARKPKLEVVK